jgi:hypothetical protein
MDLHPRTLTPLATLIHFVSYKHIKREKMERQQNIFYFKKNKQTVKFKMLCTYMMSEDIYDKTVLSSKP